MSLADDQSIKKLLDCQNQILNKMFVLTVLLGHKNFSQECTTSKSSYKIKIYLGYVFIFNH
jgi:hypothetical protein